MRSPLNLLGFDFGASSGRAMHGAFDGERLAIDEVHRFANDPVMVLDTLKWDTIRFLQEMREGLSKAVKKGAAPVSIGIDTWGVDFGLLNADGELIVHPVHYRDTRTEGMIEYAEKVLSRERIFEATGLAFMPFNTLYQLLSMAKAQKAALSQADSLLFMPDLLAYWLTGVRSTEYTIASTAQLTDPRTRTWSREILEAFSLDRALFTDIVEPGTVRGELLSTLASDVGLTGGAKVISVGQHDTASAVVAVPARKGERFAYISSGTWSLLGAETDAPVISPGVMGANYTNEGGAFGKTRVLKNIMGMWMIQECRRNWLKEGACEDYAGLAALAEREAPFLAFVDPDDARFLPRGNMPERICEYLRETNQKIPSTRGQMARVIYESLALKYRWAVTRLSRDILSHEIDCLYIVGGGANNALLNRMTACAVQKPVFAGPTEATAIGNLLMQAAALSEIGSQAQLREVVRASFAPTAVKPEDKEMWEDAYGRFLRVTGLTD